MNQVLETVKRQGFQKFLETSEKYQCYSYRDFPDFRSYGYIQQRSEKIVCYCIDLFEDDHIYKRAEFLENFLELLIKEFGEANKWFVSDWKFYKPSGWDDTSLDDGLWDNYESNYLIPNINRILRENFFLWRLFLCHEKLLDRLDPRNNQLCLQTTSPLIHRPQFCKELRENIEKGIFAPRPGHFVKV